MFAILLLVTVFSLNMVYASQYVPNHPTLLHRRYVTIGSQPFRSHQLIRAIYGNTLQEAINTYVYDWRMPPNEVYVQSSSEDYWHFDTIGAWITYWEDQSQHNPNFVYYVEGEFHVDYGGGNYATWFGGMNGDIDQGNFRMFVFLRQWRPSTTISLGSGDVETQIEKGLGHGLGIGECWAGRWFPWINCMFEAPDHYSPFSHTSMCASCRYFFNDMYWWRGWFLY